MFYWGQCHVKGAERNAAMWNSFGSVSVAARTVAYDEYTYEPIYGSWNTLSFLWESALTAVFPEYGCRDGDRRRQRHVFRNRLRRFHRRDFHCSVATSEIRRTTPRRLDV